MIEDAGIRLNELTDDECYQLLGSSHIGRLGLIDDDGPLVLPVNYCLDDRSVVFRTDGGAKLDAVSHGSPVAFEVDGIDAAQRVGWSVLIRGSAALVDSDELSRLQQLPLFPWAPGRKPHYVRVSGVPSGRRITLAGMPSRWWG